MEVHLEEVRCSHEFKDVPCLDGQLLRRAIIEVLHHLGGGSGRSWSRSCGRRWPWGRIMAKGRGRVWDRNLTDKWSRREHELCMFKSRVSGRNRRRNRSARVIPTISNISYLMSLIWRTGGDPSQNLEFSIDLGVIWLHNFPSSLVFLNHRLFIHLNLKDEVMRTSL